MNIYIYIVALVTLVVRIFSSAAVQRVEIPYILVYLNTGVVYCALCFIYFIARSCVVLFWQCIILVM
jgi:hypothetical protein